MAQSVAAGKITLRGALCLALFGLGACAEIPKEPATTAEQSIDSQQQICVRLLRRLRYMCTDNRVRDNSGLRGGSSRTNFDCMATRLEFQSKCNQ